MTTIESAAPTIRALGAECEVDEAQLAAVSFLARYSGRTRGKRAHRRLGCRGVPPRPARLLPVRHRPRHRRHVGEPCAHRAVPRLDGGPRARGVDDRPSALDGRWLLPVRAHRRPHPLEPRPVRTLTPGPRIERPGLNRSELGVFLFTAEQYDRDHAALACCPGRTVCEPAKPVPPTSRTSASSAAIAR
jgi:hypothetical protein